jgi:hypothetical protein
MILYIAAQEAMETISQYLVQREEIHAAKWWEKALNMEDMCLGQ